MNTTSELLQKSKVYERRKSSIREDCDYVRRGKRRRTDNTRYAGYITTKHVARKLNGEHVSRDLLPRDYLSRDHVTDPTRVCLSLDAAVFIKPLKELAGRPNRTECEHISPFSLLSKVQGSPDEDDNVTFYSGGHSACLNSYKHESPSGYTDKASDRTSQRDLIPSLLLPHDKTPPECTKTPPECTKTPPCTPSSQNPVQCPLTTNSIEELPNMNNSNHTKPGPKSRRLANSKPSKTSVGHSKTSAICGLFDDIWSNSAPSKKSVTDNKSTIHALFKTAFISSEKSPSQKPKTKHPECKTRLKPTHNPATNIFDFNEDDPVKHPEPSPPKFHCFNCDFLSSIQETCAGRAKLQSMNLVLRRTVPNLDLLKSEKPRPRYRHSRYRHSSRKRKRKNHSSVADADDELSDEESFQGRTRPNRRALVSGPLKHMTAQDLWMQKEVYLRYLCNFYSLSSVGCREWLISRLRQYVLQLTRFSDLSKPRYLKYRPISKRREHIVSWVKIVAQNKLDDETENT